MAESSLPELNALRAERGQPRGPECPPEEIWTVVAHGLVKADAELELLTHASTCAHCVVYLRDAAAVVEAERRKQTPGLRNWAVWAAAAALLVVIVMGGLGMYERWHVKELEREISAAYRTERPFSYRISEVPWGPARQFQGQGATRVLNAPAGQSISELHWAARAALWEGDSRRAGNLLEQVKKATSSAEIESDLAVAYAQAGDLDRASRILAEAAGKYSGDSSIPFNRGLVLRQLGARAEASKYLQEAARATQDAQWRQEAERLAQQ